MGQTSVSFESMSSIKPEKTHQKRPYGSLRTPPIPALPGSPKNPQHSILQYHPRVSSSYCQARFYFFLMQWATGSSIMDPLYPLVFRTFSAWHQPTSIHSSTKHNCKYWCTKIQYTQRNWINFWCDGQLASIFWILDEYIKLNNTATETSSLIL
jgi:hypothetical protein